MEHTPLINCNCHEHKLHVMGESFLSITNTLIESWKSPVKDERILISLFPCIIATNFAKTLSIKETDSITIIVLT